MSSAPIHALSIHAQLVASRATESVMSALSGLPIPSTPATAIPGTSTLTGLVRGLVVIGLIACFLGVVVSAISMSVGHHTSNSRLAERGRSGLLASILGAVVLGAALAIISFAFNVGGGIS